MSNEKKKLSPDRKDALLSILKTRFEENMARHKDLEWVGVASKLQSNSEKLWSLNEMKETGGEPDVVGYLQQEDACIFYDCSAESPNGRRSLCYDQEAYESRKKYKPKNSALGMAAKIGIQLLSEDQYFELQQLGKVDTKTSSWLFTPSNIRKHGGAIFGDWRFGRTFIYHNGAESYYGSRGFRGWLMV
ncbi:MAG: DUF4256 domain-containing protein [Salibacteraceae bacterium]